MSLISHISDYRIKTPGWFLLLVFCLLSRLLTSIYYIEDIDSLRFALAVQQDYSVAELRPHFPGYPVFCFAVRSLYLISGKMALSFSMAGGLAVFMIIFYAVNISRFMEWQVSELLLGILVFISPLLWLMSNRYMPDLAGLGILMACTYYLLKGSGEKSAVFLTVFAMLAGLLLGTRLSFAPFILPAVMLLNFFPRYSLRLSTAFLACILLWLLPLIADTGWQELVSAAKEHTDGHFNDWGGSVISAEAGHGTRFSRMLRGIWADGLGGWWPGRHWLTVVFSVSLLSAFAAALVGIDRFRHKSGKHQQHLLLFISLAIYGIWVYFFQNIVHKPRHILPLLPFLLIMAAAGLEKLRKLNLRLFLIIALSLISSGIMITGKLVYQHMQPSAVAQLGKYLENRKEEKTVASGRLVNYYLSKHGNITAGFVNLEKKEDPAKSAGGIIYSTSPLDHIRSLKLQDKTIFYHNPYVNRLWPVITVYSYRPKAAQPDTLNN